MMVSKLEEGADKVTAATFAYTSTAFPMLTGTLVTIAGFVPVGFAASSAGEYCFTLFAVVAIALTASWFVAVLFTPLTGVFILPNKLKGHSHGPSRFARAFHKLIDRVLRIRYAVIGVTVALFVAALVGLQFVQQQFFPSSDRPELLVDLTLPQGSSINATRSVVETLARKHHRRATSKGSTFPPPAICGCDGSNPWRSSRLETSERARRKPSFRLLVWRRAILKKASPK